MNKAIQGTGDGLCGLYGLVNFLLHKKEIEDEECRPKQRVAMLLLNQVADRLNLFTPYHVADGHTWAELKEIFNAFSDRWEMEYRAVSLNAVYRHLGNARGKNAVLSDIVNQQGAAVILVDKGQHWVLVTAKHVDGSFVIVDPFHGKVKGSVKSIANVSQGIALLPSQSELLAKLSA